MTPEDFRDAAEITIETEVPMSRANGVTLHNIFNSNASANYSITITP